MNKENIADTKVEVPTVRITRSQAKTLGILGRQVLKPPRSEQNRVLRDNSKGVASEVNKPTVPVTRLQKRRRGTLTDVTNVICEKIYEADFAGEKFQKSKKEKKGLVRKNVRAASSFPEEMQHDQDVKDQIAEDISRLTVQPHEIALVVKENTVIDVSKLTEHHKCPKLDDNLGLLPIGNETAEGSNAFPVIVSLNTDKPSEEAETSDCPTVVDIDNQKDPLLCSIYASDIYENKRLSELNQTPIIGYLEKMQHDTSPSMRGILINWLVEVSEEYKLVPDTLYLTVNLIDRYLSGNYIEKQKLQLLGVTCMLIASKYEEMSAPQIEVFCYITANTYTREEVLKMERKVLNFLCFQLSIPTTKAFLRRFIHAAQSTYKVPLADLEFLANYLAELTLVEYSFLKFLPSLIAASAVFLARWTLDHSVHPWNPTLEHYTCYEATDLKDTVIAMQGLQLNITDCPLNAIREKYRHQKFNSVADLSSPKSVQCLF